MALKITINGKEYHSLDEVPEELRHVIEEGVAQGLHRPSSEGKVVVKKTFKFAIGHPPPEFLRLPLASPEDYRRQVESMQSGSIPSLLPLEPLIALFFVLVIAGAIWMFASEIIRRPPIQSFAVLAPLFLAVAALLGLVWLWDRRRRRKLASMLQDLGGRFPGAFVVVIQSTPRLFITREGLNGGALFAPGTEDHHAFSRFDASIAPAPVRLSVRARGFLDRFRAVDELIQTGDEEFDGRFVISSNDRAFALGLLDPGRRTCLVRLGAFGNPLVDLHDGFIRVQVDKNLGRVRGGVRQDQDRENLQSFLSDAILLAESAARLSATPR